MGFMNIRTTFQQFNGDNSKEMVVKLPKSAKEKTKLSSHERI